MALSDAEADEIDAALQNWRQGDITLDAGLEFLYFGDLMRPHSPASQQTAAALAAAGEEIAGGPAPLLDEVAGLVVLSQTCDVIRRCRARPFVEVAPLIRLDADTVEAARRLKSPAFAYVPTVAPHGLVADLDRVMTVEKALMARWTRVPGWTTDDEVRAFAQALSRKRMRFAFPDDFVSAARRLQARLADKHNRDSDEGKHLRALREIRVRAAPSWDAEEVQINWWFIKDRDPSEVEVTAWGSFAEKWLTLFDWSGRFSADPPVVCRLEDMTARDYTESDLLDLDRLSAPQ